MICKCAIVLAGLAPAALAVADDLPLAGERPAVESHLDGDGLTVALLAHPRLLFGLFTDQGADETLTLAARSLAVAVSGSSGGGSG